MKKCIYSFAAVLFLALSCVLTSCESKNEKLIVGEWVNYDNDYTWKFLDDGSFSERSYSDYDGDYNVYNGTWKINKDELTLRFGIDASIFDIDELTDKKLVVSAYDADWGFESMQFRRVK